VYVGEGDFVGVIDLVGVMNGRGVNVADGFVDVVIIWVDCNPGVIKTCVWIGLVVPQPIRMKVKNINNPPNADCLLIDCLFILTNSSIIHCPFRALCELSSEA
jgi:hypothetical protein